MFVDYKGDYMFHETLSASPQCFKVYFRNDKDMKTQIAEVRVSRGVIRCYVPDVSGKEIFKKDMKHELSAFKDENEKQHYFKGVMWSLDKYVKL